MKVVGLVSGGKDSCYAMMKCIEYGHEIVALANLLPADDSVDELDSYMYQTVGHQMVVGFADCMGVPLFRRRIQGCTRDQNLTYSMTPGDEVEDLFILLMEVKRQIPSITAVSSGAIASDYQRLRVESVCSRLGLISLAFMWKQEQSVLLQDMINKGIHAITVKVAAMGLEPKKHLGKELSQLESYLHKLKELYGINVCGEGGEYETLTLDCPLFKNARLVLDKFDIILHSPDSIAPVGVLHPLAFHLESKLNSESLSQCDKINNGIVENTGAVHEVLGDCLQKREGDYPQTLDLAEISGHELYISKTRKDDTFSISCWLQDSCKTSKDLREDLSAVLRNIESQLMECGSSWESVLYIHLYISDMSQFAVANETYVKYIRQEKCRYGVPSRSTIELPLLKVGLGRAYIEVLVANDQSKRVLHVQSISCWAPSCIGPYSQATLHKEILHMAGQLGLDPPTMLLCSGGPTAELVQALHNSEAVAKSFHSSISTSTILFTVYCSASVPSSERTDIQDKLDVFLKQLKSLNLRDENQSQVLDTMVLYVLVPDLPKRASVEVKPMLYVANDTECDSDDDVVQDVSNDTKQCYWGLQHEQWQHSCFQKCVVRGKICAAVLSVTNELAMKIYSDSIDTYQDNGTRENCLANRQTDRIARFCVFLIEKILVENHFSWNEVMNLRIYYPAAMDLSHDSLSLVFIAAFQEFSEMNPRFEIGDETIFNLVPVLGAGRSARSTDDMITCELFAQKS